MIIVLEGPDGGGKTTLSESIKGLFPTRFHSLRCGPPGDDAFGEYASIVDQAAQLSEAGKIVVVDRLHLGELVYGLIFRGHSQITMDQAREIDRRLDQHGTIKAAVMPSTAELVRRQIARDGGAPDKKSGATVGHTRGIRARYAWVLSGLSGWVHVGNGYPDQIAVDIMEYARR